MISLIKGWGRDKIASFLDKHEYRLLNKMYLKYYNEFTINILKEVENTVEDNEIDSIVFSKDRAMQLHAFLTSYIQKVKNRKRMYILYRCSNGRHQKSYEQLKELYLEENFLFIEEKDFRNQLIETLERSRAGKFLFYVDDMIFTHEVDYSILAKIKTSESILTLSRGKDMDYSVVLQKSIEPPPFTEEGNGLIKFSWNHSKERTDWAYPLGVSGYMYGRIEILAMLKSISFKAPNSLEIAMQIYLPYYINRYGLCTEFAACICVHANLVQSEVKNTTLGTYSVEELLSFWEAGKRIELNGFYGKPINITQEQKYTFK